MTLHLRPSQPDEPAVTSPELRRLVDAARAAGPPRVRVTADAVLAGLEVRRRGQTRALLGLAVAAAAVVALVAARPWVSHETAPIGHVAQTMPDEPSTGAPPLSPPTPPALAAAARVLAEDGPPPRVLGPWELELPPGRYAVAVEPHPGADLLRVRAAGGVVEVSHGRVQITVAGAHAEVALVTGVATWVAADGARTALVPADVPADSQPAAPVDGPAELARRAEDLLAAGRRDAAAAVLRQLVTAHPTSPQARSGLLDLAGLLKTDGRTDEARCAYSLYLARYPGKEQLADEVRRALDRLGDGPACRGLRPR